MIVFRLSKTQYADDLSGKGAEIAGGRWNSKGTPMIYTAESRALCIAELAMYLPLGFVPKDFSFISFTIPDNIPVFNLQKDQLPFNWNVYPHPNETQEIGDRFVKENKYLLMKVPSVIVEEEFNYLINPRHKFIQKIVVSVVTSFSFNARLFNRKK
jgi:RES domain-containing protein